MNWSPAKFLRSRRGVLLLVVAFLLLLFFVRPGADRLRSRIVNSISAAIGRPVEISWVKLHFLPRPGFDLENFVVYDDPAFSAEPVLRSQEVQATIRVTSLFRGRLEISRLNLTEPSLNLVRTGEGHWNLGGFVERASRTPVAPTGKAKGESRPGFPYIEASNGRINFKLGQEKKPYILTDADFSVWQESENAWGMRLKAQPMRTDLNLSDTGTVRVEGAWQRSEMLGETPLRFTAQWERAQLGQLTRFISGSDRGWRGAVQVSAAITGKPSDLVVDTRATIDDFRRYDIVGGDSLHLAAQCSGHYDSLQLRLSDLNCQAPVAGGNVQVGGSIAGWHAPRSYDLTFELHDLPMSAGILLARHAKKDIPDDLIAAGKLDGKIQLLTDKRTLGASVWQGGGSIQGCRLTSKTTGADLSVDRIAFSINKPQTLPESRIEVGPVHADLGAPGPANMQAWFSRTGYSLQVQGGARVRRLLQAARTIGLAAPQPNADGQAKVDVQIAGAWTGFQRPSVTGKAQLSSVQAEVGGVRGPLEIASARVTLREDNVLVQDVNASLGDMKWHGSLSLPRHCVDPDQCILRFDLQTKDISGEQLARAFAPASRQQPWYRFLSASGAAKFYLASLHAEGRLSAARFTVHQVTTTQASAKVVWRKRQLQLTDFRATLLGGTHGGEWNADFSGTVPRYSGTGAFQHLVLGQIAQAMKDGWVTGTGDASYQVSATGNNLDEILTSARATFQVEARDAVLPHILLTANEPLLARSFKGRLTFHEGKLEFAEATLDSPGGIYQLKGTASRGRSLDFKLLREKGHGFEIKGTLAAPRVVQSVSSDTQASLKAQ